MRRSGEGTLGRWSLPACFGVLALAACFASPSALAHEHETEARNALQAPAVLGRLSFPTSTKSRQAQAAFVRGMLWLHLFEYPNALAEFQDAQRIDPGFAMAYWGEAMTSTHAIWNQDDPAAARAALAKLGATPQQRAARAGTPREKAYLDAADKLFGDGTLKERDTAFLKAMEALALAYPDDDEAQLLHALALLGVTRGERNVPNYLAAAAIAKRVYARNPDHPGAAHYWIHGMDDPEHAAGALEAARALSKIAPNAGHAQHMTSHIFMALGMWQDVLASNESAIEVVAEERRAKHLPVVACGHYSEWLQYTDYQLGRHHAAQDVLAGCMRDAAAAIGWYQAHPDQRIPGAKSLEFLKAYLARSIIALRATALVESTLDRRRNAALALDIAPGDRLAGWDAFARGWAAVEIGDTASAASDSTALQAIVRQTPDEKSSPAEQAYLDILGLMLKAAMAAPSGQADTALSAATDASRRFDALPFDFGPPATVKPPHELAGELLLKAGRPKQALAEFDKSLQVAPNRALSLLGRARALAASGDAHASAQAYAQLAAIWRDADADLPGLAEVRGGAIDAAANGK